MYVNIICIPLCVNIASSVLIYSRLVCGPQNSPPNLCTFCTHFSRMLNLRIKSSGKSDTAISRFQRSQRWLNSGTIFLLIRAFPARSLVTVCHSNLEGIFTLWEERFFPFRDTYFPFRRWFLWGDRKSVNCAMGCRKQFSPSKDRIRWIFSYILRIFYKTRLYDFLLHCCFNAILRGGWFL